MRPPDVLKRRTKVLHLPKPQGAQLSFRVPRSLNFPEVIMSKTRSPLVGEAFGAYCKLSTAERTEFNTMVEDLHHRETIRETGKKTDSPNRPPKGATTSGGNAA